MNYRLILILPFFIIFIGLSELIRDIFKLPFFGDRLYLFYLLIFILSFSTYVYLTNIFNSYKFNKFTNIEYIFLIFIISFFLIDLYKFKNHFFVPLQLINVLLFLYFFKLITRNISHVLINKCFLNFTYLISLCMSIIWLFWLLGKDSLLDLKTRNSIPYIILGIYFYIKSLDKKMNIVLFCFFLLILICQTKGAILLFFLVYILELYNKKYTLSKKNYTFIIAFLFFTPLIIIFIFNYYFSTNYEDLIELDKFRYYIRDDLSSFISRILGGGYLLLLNFNYLFPIGVLDNIDKDQLFFWGYPIHNYLYLIIIQYGLVGIAFTIFILILVKKIMLKNLSLGVSLLYCLLNFNDFYIGFIIFLLPLFNYSNQKIVDLNSLYFTIKTTYSNKNNIK